MATSAHSTPDSKGRIELSLIRVDVGTGAGWGTGTGSGTGTGTGTGRGTGTGTGRGTGTGNGWGIGTTMVPTRVGEGSAEADEERTWSTSFLKATEYLPEESRTSPQALSLPSGLDATNPALTH